MWHHVLLSVAVAVVVLVVCQMATAGEFQDLGVPVRTAGPMGVVVGPNADGTKDLVYFNFMQTSGKLFLLEVDPDTGEARQYGAPREQAAWAFVLGPDKRLYFGTVGQALYLRFDPKQPDEGIQVVGRPSKTESYIWQFAVSQDGTIYGCTYPSAKLVSYEPATDRLEDLGRMSATEQYARSVAVGPNGKVYVGIGTTKQDLIVFDPTTRAHRSLVPPEWRVPGFGTIYAGADGQVYGRITPPADENDKRRTRTFRIDDEKLVDVKGVPTKALELRDGRTVSDVEYTKDGGRFVCGPRPTVHGPGAQRPETEDRGPSPVTFQYKGDGCRIFVVGVGPKDCIYGSTVMPLEVFRYDPSSGGSEHLGNMPGGEVYSMLEHQGKLYLCYYGGSIMNLYDPDNPVWKWGSAPDCNPRSFGGVGDGHLRPRAMIRGPEEMIYVGSHPAYGQLGGAMGVWDPEKNKTIENYRHLVKDQSIAALAYEPVSGLIFGGSGNYGGGGTRPTQKEALFFAFDPVSKKKVFETALVPGARTYQAMCAAGGKVFVAVDAKLLVYDPATREVVHTADLPDVQIGISLGLHTDGLLYGLTHTAIYSVDPKSFAVHTVAKPPVRIECGFALAKTGLYFGSGVHLWSYRW